MEQAKGLQRAERSVLRPRKPIFLRPLTAQDRVMTPVLITAGIVNGAIGVEQMRTLTARLTKRPLGQVRP